MQDDYEPPTIVFPQSNFWDHVLQSRNDIFLLSQMCDKVSRDCPDEESYSSFRCQVYRGNLPIELNNILQKNLSFGKKSTYVYLCKNNRNGYTKIGYSSNPKYRETVLQSEEPDVAIVWARIGSRQDEAQLHKQFEPKRIRGEWFILTEDDINSIKGGYAPTVS